MSSALPLPVSPRPQAGEWLTPAELDPPYLTQDGSLVAAVDLFQSNPELRLLPVVNPDHRPVGAIFEKDVRRLLLNPFGHALLRNPAYGHSIRSQIRACPTAEAGLEFGALIDAYREANGTEGMILTRHGRLLAAVNNRRLVHLAAERELQRAQTGLERARRIERASEAFEHHVRALTGAMGELAARLEANAETTASRAGDVGQRAVAVATAASQTSLNMGEIADRGRELARAFGQIGHNTSEAENAAAEAVALVGAGSARARDLLASAHSIDAVIALIGEIAGQVNLLALNATIEAARAGEAGKGFTVVANEVKQLSTQTGRAAATITAHVREIRHGIDEVAAGHAEVERAITAIAARSAEIQTAVGTQEAATRTIARNVEEAVEASTGIHRDVEAIGGTSREASGSAHEMGGLAHRLQQGASALSEQVRAFLEEIRAR